MGFWVDSWLHEMPDTNFDRSGKRAIVNHKCFGPLETRIWYELKDGRYCCEVHFIEGVQAGDIFTDFISRAEMLKTIDNEIELCKKHNEIKALILFQTEKEKIKK